MTKRKDMGRVERAASARQVAREHRQLGENTLARMKVYERGWNLFASVIEGGGSVEAAGLALHKTLVDHGMASDD